MENYYVCNGLPISYGEVDNQSSFSYNYNHHFYFIPFIHINTNHFQKIELPSFFHTTQHQQTIQTKKIQNSQLPIRRREKEIIVSRKKKSILKTQLSQEQYSLGNKKEEPVTYKKKNTESNIVNQTFSYLSTQKSQNQLLTMFKSNYQKVNEFYKFMSRVKQQKKKYINRRYLLKLFNISESGDLYRAYLKCKNISLSLQEIKEILRRLIFYYLRYEASPSLLTSSKIHKNTLPQLFERKRQIEDFLFRNKVQ